MSLQIKLLRENVHKIEKRIDYSFKNKDLLIQAFIRTTYKEENGGEDNQVLEFIGDKCLDTAIIRLMMGKYSSISHHGYNDGENLDLFVTKLDEGQFTNLKKNLVDKIALSEFMDELGFNSYLIMGNGDIKGNVGNEVSVKEDLFEAIIGAVAIDSNYNINIITNVVMNMINLDKYLDYNTTVNEANVNYVGLLQEWYQNKYKCTPEYIVNEAPGKKFKAIVILKNICKAEGIGTSKDNARYEAARKAYKILEDRNLILTELQYTLNNLDKDNALTKYNELIQKKLIIEPRISQQQIASNGGLLWCTKLELRENGKIYEGIDSGKNKSKGIAVYNALTELLK